MLAATGIASRRRLEDWIRSRRITVNGKIAVLGQKVSRTDRIEIDGQPVALRVPGRLRVLAYHKPVGEICTRNDPGRRVTVFDNLPELSAGRWIGVGRLDINSSGLILLTTDGKLADALMRPATGVVREYRVRVLGAVSEKMLAKLRSGVKLEEGVARFKSVQPAGGSGGVNRWFVCRLTEGRNREVRRLWEAVGCQVSRLIRTRYGSVQLPRQVRPGESYELDDRATAELYRCAGIDVSED